MKKNNNISRIKDTNRGVEIILNTNHEEVENMLECDSYETEQIIITALDAVEDKLHDLTGDCRYTAASRFTDWHGGRYYQLRAASDKSRTYNSYELDEYNEWVLVDPTEEGAKIFDEVEKVYHTALFSESETH